MEPITAAIIAAILAGVPKGMNVVANDAYQGLKSLVIAKWQKKHGKDEKNKLAKAIDNVEDEPESAGYQQVVSEQLAKAGAETDPDVLTAAQALVVALEQVAQRQPGATGAKFIDDEIAGNLMVDQVVADGAGSVGIEVRDSKIGKDVHLGPTGAKTSSK